MLTRLSTLVLLCFFRLLFSFHSSTFFSNVYIDETRQAARKNVKLSAREWKCGIRNIKIYAALFYVVFVVELRACAAAAADDFDYFFPIIHREKKTKPLIPILLTLISMTICLTCCRLFVW